MRSRRQRALVGVIVVALLVVAGVVYASRSTKSRSSPPPSSESAPTTATGTFTPATITPGPYLTSSSFGISTGVVLFNESVDQIDKDMDGIAALGAHWVRTSARWDSIEANN